MSGRRNEPARARRRQRVKEALSLTSVPKSEQEESAPSPKLNLDNHFGWVVLQKSHLGDGFFPHLFQYYEKPDLHGRDFDKVTYVLYMDKGTVVDKRTTAMGTQTAVSGVFISGEPSTVKEHYDQPPSTTRESYFQPPSTAKEFYVQPQVEHIYRRDIVQQERPKVSVAPETQIMYEYIPERRKKKKMISEFYYVRRDRSRSRSPGGDRYKGGGYSDADSGGQNLTSDLSSTNLSQSGNVIELGKNALNKKDPIYADWQKSKEEIRNEINSAKAKKDHYADGYNLRAGAEKVEREYLELKEKYENTSEIVRNKSVKVKEYVKSKAGKNEIAEELLNTSSGTNEYLYVSGKKRLR